MKRLSFIVLPLLLGPQAYGMMSGDVLENQPGRAPAASAAPAAPEIRDLSEQQFKQQFLADFEGQDALVTQSPAHDGASDGDTAGPA